MIYVRLKPQINSDLNKYYSLDVSSKIIANNTNLNSCTTPGQYKTESAGASATITNTPYKGSGFKLMVEFLSNSGHIMQTLKAVNAPYCYYRTGNKSGDTWNWNAWNQILTNADTQAGTVLVSAAANGTTEFSVKFPNAFSKTPIVVASVVTSRPDLRSVSPLNRSTTGFTGVVYNGTTASDVSVFWTAIAP